VVQYVLGDHLGSTSVVLNDDGTVHSEGRYYPYGVTRWSSGTLPTDYRFTGQREESGLGLYQMGARWYDAALGRWSSADTIVPEPGNPQDLNRYAYVGGNPLRYRDPSGHYHRDVHYDLTYDLTCGIAKEIAVARGLSVDEADTVATQLAEGVASANQWADQEPFNISLVPGTNHWKSHEQAREDMEEAVRQASTLSFGYSLHAVQDYFAHFSQGSIALAGAQGRNRWICLWSQDDRFSATGADLEELNPVPVELREFFAQDWGHGGKSYLLGIDPDAFDWNDPWDQVMVAETEYYLWEFLQYWFEWHYGEQPVESTSDE
jgi:RHS repeat-associated protein